MPTPRLNKNVLYIGVALMLGLVAAVATVGYIRTEVDERTRDAATEMVPVAVPKRDMDIGTVIQEADLAVREVPTDFVPADAVTPDNYAELMGRMLRAPVREGAPLPGAALVPLYDQFSRLIEAGKVGYTLQVDETNSISGMVAPGDRVDILMSVEQDGGNTRVLPLLEDINVLATGTRVGEQITEEEGALGYSTMTLELLPQHAERLAVADKAGELRVLLRQRDDEAAFGLNGLTENELLRGAPRPAVYRPRARGVEFIIGGGS